VLVCLTERLVTNGILQPYQFLRQDHTVVVTFNPIKGSNHYVSESIRKHSLFALSQMEGHTHD
jgi:hypothetical protein